MPHPKALVLALLPLVACGPDNAEEAFGCVVDATEIIDDLEAVPEGFSFSALEALDRTEGDFTGTAVLEGGGSQVFALRIERSSDPVIERRVWEDAGMEIAAQDCHDAYTYAAGIELESADDLDDSAAGRVSVDATGAGSLTLELPLEAMTGEALPRTFDPADMTRTWLEGHAATIETGWEGEISFVGERIDDSGPDGVASATLDPWGTFTVQRDQR